MRERKGGEGKPRRFHDYERPIEADPIFETCQPLRQARRPRGHGSRISCEALSHSRCLATVETISLNLCTPARQWRWRWRHSYRRCSRGRNIFTEEEVKKKKKKEEAVGEITKHTGVPVPVIEGGKETPSTLVTLSDCRRFYAEKTHGGRESGRYCTRGFDKGDTRRIHRRCR